MTPKMNLSSVPIYFSRLPGLSILKQGTRMAKNLLNSTYILHVNNHFASTNYNLYKISPGNKLLTMKHRDHKKLELFVLVGCNFCVNQNLPIYQIRQKCGQTHQSLRHAQMSQLFTQKDRKFHLTGHSHTKHGMRKGA